jgi:tetratricopeptide (TPR) repeat protein
MNKKAFFFLVFVCLNFFAMWSQNEIIQERGVSFIVEITIVDEKEKRITNNVVFSVNGNTYNTVSSSGIYRIPAKVGDQIRVSHPDFDTVYYTLLSNEEIKIIVKGYEYEQKNSLVKFSKSKLLPEDVFFQNLDSVRFYKTKDIERSIFFIEKIIENNESKKRNAVTYKLLGDVYFYWKQFDLAAYNYKLSYQIKEEKDTKIALAEAQFLSEKFKDSKETYRQLLKERLSKFEKVQVYEGLGNVYFEEQLLDSSKNNYEKGLQIAKENDFILKVIDLNSKLADVYASLGNLDKAEKLFKNSITLAKNKKPERILTEEEKLANFYDDNNRFDDEIQLRKQSLEKINLKVDSVTNNATNSNKVTSQRINYKIGNAYILKEDFKNAVPYLEQSIKDADGKEDIVVEKNATRKISEAFASLGEYDKALESYQDYVKLVDKAYIKKEQEIEQVKRFSRKIAENQNRIISLEKDKELAESRINLAYIDQRLSEESNQRQRIIIYSLFGGVVLLCLLALFMSRNIKQQKFANNLLALKSMRSQMNPHFIFNALNSVNSFISVNDERNANRYLSEFSALMRAVLENSDEDFIPLTKEIELLDLYVKLEHNRFKNKFDYTISVDENIDLDQFSIPPMLLQPYIENAIWHGLRYKEEKGTLTIAINQKDNETVSIEITDDGIGRKRSQELKTKNQLKQKSKGMSTIKNRVAILNDMYKERVAVNVTNVFKDNQGTRVILLLKKE